MKTVTFQRSFLLKEYKNSISVILKLKEKTALLIVRISDSSNVLLFIDLSDG